MTRRLFIALIVALLGLAAVLIAFVDQPSTSGVEPTVDDRIRVPQISSGDTELGESTADAPQPQNGDSRSDSETPEVTEAPPKYSVVDVAISRKEVREEVTRDVHGIYPLLIEELDLTSSEQDALLSFLIEDGIARTRTSYSSGIGMSEEKRSARIAALIGEGKLRQFLALEQNIDEYREVFYVQSMLKQKGAPLSDTQQDRLAKILIDVRERVDMKPPVHIKRNTIESLQHTLHRLNEYERLALELAPTVLSAKQVEYMFERYQTLSYRRADALELHKQRRAENPDDDQPLWYPSRRN